MEERAEEYKRMNVLIQAPTQEPAPTQLELKLVKACWNQFGLFSCLDDQIMQECVSFMVVCYFRWCILTDCILFQRHLTFKELQVQSFAKGATIIKKGSVGTALYFLDVGIARVAIE